MQNSRMGFYIHEGVSEGFVHLRELITQKQIKAIVPSGYMGSQGEIWFARIMPEPFAKLNYGYSVVFTTPYIISDFCYIWKREKGAKALNIFKRRQEKDMTWHTENLGRFYTLNPTIKVSKVSKIFKVFTNFKSYRTISQASQMEGQSHEYAFQVRAD